MATPSSMPTPPEAGPDRDVQSRSRLLHIPLSLPPSLVGIYGGFGTGIHGLRGDEHYRNRFWVLNLISGPGGVFTIAGEDHPFHDGCAILAPPDTDHRYHFQGPTRKIWAHFLPEPGATAAPFPAVQDLGPRGPRCIESLIHAMHQLPGEPDRGRAVLWNLLFSLSCGPIGGTTPVHHPTIRALLVHLGEHLAQATDPASLAQHLGTSPSTLNRLCRAAFGLPVAGYIRHRRLERALHLLRHTNRPVTDIAVEVGYPDPQHFNKLIRAHSGRGPRAVRGG